MVLCGYCFMKTCCNVLNKYYTILNHIHIFMCVGLFVLKQVIKFYEQSHILVYLLMCIQWRWAGVLFYFGIALRYYLLFTHSHNCRIIHETLTYRAINLSANPTKNSVMSDELGVCTFKLITSSRFKINIKWIYAGNLKYSCCLYYWRFCSSLNF